jgi:hypothetical protein
MNEVAAPFLLTNLQRKRWATTDMPFDLEGSDLYRTGEEIERRELGDGTVAFKIAGARAGRLVVPSDAMGTDYFFIMNHADGMVHRFIGSPLHQAMGTQSVLLAGTGSVNHISGMVSHASSDAWRAKVASPMHVKAAPASPKFSATVHRALYWTAGLAMGSFLLTSAGLLFSNFVMGLLGGLALAAASIAAVKWLSLAEREHPEEA